MRENALRSQGPRATRAAKMAGSSVIMPNVLDRQFEAGRAEPEVGGRFYLPWTAEGWLYVAAVIDLSSSCRWLVDEQQHDLPQLVTDALITAIWRRGSRMRCCIIRTRVANTPASSSSASWPITASPCSMSRSGNVWDNAAMESFFSSLKTERTATPRSTEPDHVRWTYSTTSNVYNPKRRHSDTGLSQPDGV